jgi:hypothetical protein
MTTPSQKNDGGGWRAGFFFLSIDANLIVVERGGEQQDRTVILTWTKTFWNIMKGLMQRWQKLFQSKYEVRKAGQAVLEKNPLSHSNLELLCCSSVWSIVQSGTWGPAVEFSTKYPPHGEWRYSQLSETCDPNRWRKNPRKEYIPKFPYRAPNHRTAPPTHNNNHIMALSAHPPWSGGCWIVVLVRSVGRSATFVTLVDDDSLGSSTGRKCVGLVVVVGAPQREWRLPEWHLTKTPVVTWSLWRQVMAAEMGVCCDSMTRRHQRRNRAGGGKHEPEATVWPRF